MTTGTSVATVPRLILNRIGTLGQNLIGIRVLAHDLPPSANVDGLLGLDFLRDQIMTVDFRTGIIDLA